jgi:hypothetical protein
MDYGTRSSGYRQAMRRASGGGEVGLGTRGGRRAANAGRTEPTKAYMALIIGSKGPLSKPTTAVRRRPRERLFMPQLGHSGFAIGTALHVKGFRTPASQWRDEMLGGRRPKSLRGGNRGGVCAGSGVGLWRFSLCMPRSLDIERGSRPSNHRGVGFGRRVQDRNGGLVVSDLRLGGRRRD